MASKAVLILVFFCVACSSLRKVSESGIRAPAAASPQVVLPNPDLAWRDRLQSAPIPNTCPREAPAIIQASIRQKIDPIFCPQKYPELLHQNLDLLRLEERSLLEELLSQRCQSLRSNQMEERLLAFLASFDGLGPLGRRRAKVSGEKEDERDFQALSKLRASLEEIVQINLPLERWQYRYGSQLIPESFLKYFYFVLVERGCKINDMGLEDTYKAIDALEELQQILPNRSQAEASQAIVNLLFAIADEKVSQYFQKGNRP